MAQPPSATAVMWFKHGPHGLDAKLDLILLLPHCFVRFIIAFVRNDPVQNLNSPAPIGRGQASRSER